MPSQHGRILVAVKDARGCEGVYLEPVSARVRARVGKSNAYNGSHVAYFQSAAQLLEIRADLPRAVFYRDWSGDLAPNTGARVLIDEWTFRHLVGGQSD